jgi:hypothetical protein
MEIAGGLFQIVMPQQNLNGVQVGAGFEQVGGEAVPEHVGIHPLLNAGTASSVLAGVTRGSGVDGLIAVVSAIAGK